MPLHPVDTSRTQPPTDIELAATVRTFHAARVLVIGDIILDRYITGAVQRLSPEAPIPVLRPADTRSTLGGAANVALNIATLGGQATLIGVVGHDQAGDEIEHQVQATPGITPALVRIAGRPTTCKTRFMTGSHQLLRLDEETTAPLDHAGLEAVMQAVEARLPDTDVIVLSDYAKGVLCDGVLDAILARTAQAGLVVIADPKRPDFAAYRGATILTPNEHEVRVATRIEAVHDAEADRAGRVALDATGGQAVLVTRSAQGLTLVCRDRDALH
ncbi:MAG TPA: PfkB family carbohydrate kinase, partial [Rhodopila sp.]|nr:PfkB family carbohydrate kinase [Rhodopila sp.]